MSYINTALTISGPPKPQQTRAKAASDFAPSLSPSKTNNLHPPLTNMSRGRLREPGLSMSPKNREKKREQDRKRREKEVSVIK